MKIFKRNSFQEIAEIETEIGHTVEVETTQGITTEIEVGIGRDNRDNHRNRSRDRRDSRDNSRDKVEVEIDLTQEMEEGINQDLVQVKDTLTGMNPVTTATEQVIQYIDASSWKII